jgi:hypothetical protein
MSETHCDMTPECRNSGARKEVHARHRLGKQVSAATDTQAAIEELLGKMFSIRSVQSCYKKEFS